MKNSWSRLSLILLLFCTGQGAAAQDEGGNPANWCRNGAFTSHAEEFKLARITGRQGSRVYFHGDEEGCP